MGRVDDGGIDVAVAGTAAVGSAFEIAVRVGRGATVLDAIRDSGALERHPSLDISTVTVGIWGRVAQLTTLLEAGDRVELYRPLAIDPKEARRKRAAQLRAAARQGGAARA